MKQKAMLIKDFYNDKGALHRGEEVVIDEVDGKIAEGFIRVITVQELLGFIKLITLISRYSWIIIFFKLLTSKIS